MKLINEVMSEKTISVSPDMSLIGAVDLMASNSFNSVPVTQNGLLIGILSERDLIVKNTYIHLPTLFKLFRNLKLHRSDASLIRDQLNQAMKLLVKDVLQREIFCLKKEDTTLKAVDIFVNTGINPIPVVDENDMLVGLVDKRSMIKILGERNIDPRLISDSEGTEGKVNNLMSILGKKLMLVSKNRVRFWIFSSVLFSLVGFLIAFAIILRINN